MVGWFTSLSSSKWMYIALLAILFLVSARENLTVPNLWYDEAGQFWMAQGVDHFASPGTPDQGLVASFHANATRNLDPGGFTLLLRYWSKVSTSLVWLRILPFSFLLATTTVVFCLGRLWGLEGLSCYLLALMPFTSSLLFCFAFELRAYSMEALGTAVGLLLVHCLKRDDGSSMVLLAGFAFAFFETSRYSGIVFSLIFLGISTIVLCVETPDLRRKIVKVLILWIPSLLVLTVVYFVSLRPQMAALGGLKAPNYAFVFSSNGLLGQLKALWPSLLFVGYFLIPKNASERSRYWPLFGAVLLGNLAFMLLAYMGKHPWDAHSKWNISLAMLNVLSSCALLTSFVNWISRKNDTRKTNLWLGSAMVIVTTVLIVGVIRHSLPHVIGNMQYPSTWVRMASDLEQVDLSKVKRVYVYRNANPAVRYLFERGEFQDSKINYPGAFYFDTVEDVDPNNAIKMRQYDLFLFEQLSKPVSDENARSNGLEKVGDDGSVFVRRSRR